jgi:hypothetical protein
MQLFKNSCVQFNTYSFSQIRKSTFNILVAKYKHDFWANQCLKSLSKSPGYSPYVNKAFVYISVFKILNFIRHSTIYILFIYLLYLLFLCFYSI